MQQLVGDGIRVAVRHMGRPSTGTDAPERNVRWAQLQLGNLLSPYVQKTSNFDVFMDTLGFPLKQKRNTTLRGMT